MSGCGPDKRQPCSTWSRRQWPSGVSRGNSLAEADIFAIRTAAPLATGGLVGARPLVSNRRCIAAFYGAYPVAIRTGDSVRLQTIGNGLTVSSESLALQNAPTGDMLGVWDSEGQTVSVRTDPRGGCDR